MIKDSAANPQIVSPLELSTNLRRGPGIPQQSQHCIIARLGLCCVSLYLQYSKCSLLHYSTILSLFKTFENVLLYTVFFLYIAYLYVSYL